MAPRLDPAVVLSTALGLVLCALGAVALSASVIAQPHEETLEAMRRQSASIEPADAIAAVRASLRAAEWSDGCRHLTNAALASSYALSRAFDTGKLAAAALERCPASPHNWLRLALAREAAGDADGARTAWRLSVLTGGYVPRLQAHRIELGLRLLSGTDPEFLDLLSGQVRQAAETNPAALGAAALRTQTPAMVRAMLRDKPAELDAFEKAVAA